MEKRKLGKTGYDSSILGLGCMRLPSNDGSVFTGNINEEEAVKMIRYAIDNGVNYLDTAYVYHAGRSETVLGKALKKGYRAKAKIATKSPIYNIKEEKDFERFLDEQLKRLGTDHIDFYLLHTVNAHLFENFVVKFDLMSKCEKAKKDGKIGHIGFSFHDELPVFKKIIDYYDKWEFCLMQLNYLNETHQQGLEGLHYAYEKGLGVVIMEPLLGGKLANPANAVKQLFAESEGNKTPVEWALDYLWNMPEVTTIISGMNNIEQVKDNISYAEKSKQSMFTEKENKIIKDAQATFASLSTINCTKCAYCMPCPQGVHIPNNFEFYNNYFMYDTPQIVKNEYEFFKMESGGKQTADKCVGCMECEVKCPQKIEIAKEMTKVSELFSK